MRKLKDKEAFNHFQLLANFHKKFKDEDAKFIYFLNCVGRTQPINWDNPSYNTSVEFLKCYCRERAGNNCKACIFQSKPKSDCFITFRSIGSWSSVIKDVQEKLKKR